MTDIHDLVPKNKFDSSNIERLKHLTDNEIEPILPSLLEWIQDCNWPVAGDILPVLALHQSALVPLIHRVLSPHEKDDINCPYSGCFGFDNTAFILIVFLQCRALHLHLRAIILSVFQLGVQVGDRELDFDSGFLDGFHLFVIQIGVIRQQMLCCAIELR